MTNQATIATLESRIIPPESQCDLPQATADAIAKHIRVVGLASQIASPSGVTTPVTNNVGQQALTLAQGNAEKITTLEGNVAHKRVVAYRNNVPQGDSVQPYAISPAMPDSNYEVRVSFYGGSTHPTNIYGWRILDGSVQSNQFSIVYDNVPASTLVTVIVEQNLSVNP